MPEYDIPGNQMTLTSCCCTLGISTRFGNEKSMNACSVTKFIQNRSCLIAGVDNVTSTHNKKKLSVTGSADNDTIHYEDDNNWKYGSKYGHGYDQAPQHHYKPGSVRQILFDSHRSSHHSHSGYSYY
jgi:hypothetical protein